MKMFQLLDVVGRHPDFINDKSLSKLRAFLAGYESAVSEFHIEDAASFSDLRAFSEWIAKHYGYRTAGAKSWYTMILAKTESDEKAYDAFFKLLQTYRNQRGHDDL